MFCIIEYLAGDTNLVTDNYFVQFHISLFAYRLFKTLQKFIKELSKNPTR